MKNESSTKKEKKELTVYLDEQMFVDFKIMCVKKRTSMQQFILKFIVEQMDLYYR